MREEENVFGGGGNEFFWWGRNLVCGGIWTFVNVSISMLKLIVNGFLSIGSVEILS